jgi:O-antigen ligase
MRDAAGGARHPARLAMLAGLSAAALQHAGALKSLPGLAALPFDLTAAALALLLPAALLLASGRRWALDRALAPPLLAAAGLVPWLVIAGLWSPSREVLAAKLAEVVLLGPLMLALGLVVGAERDGLRAFCAGVLALGLAAGAAVAWGVAADRVVLGGEPGADPERVRVQYQLVGLAIAAAGGLAALRMVEGGRPSRPGDGGGAVRRLAWLGVTAGLACAALVPGGRLALLALALGVALAPLVLLWLRGAVRAAVLWLGGFAGLAAVLGLLVLLDPRAAEGLRTLERLLGPAATPTPARLLLWEEALRWAGQAAPFGLGTGGFTAAAGFGEDRGFYPHNHALEALAEGGLPGFALWLGAFGGAAVLALRRAAFVAPERAARVAALSLPVALSVMVSTDLGNRTAWFALGLVLSLAVEARRREGA